ncbi:group III truncated hemoglobin [Variovorax sp. J22P240]|uniref:group III truncated hemoglobin n=1 Tax=unclassified Variovorax TaxID=663243 RepID=UPI002575FC8B|nr:MULTISPECIES: group III truncated hemoglobin [unclassified Variovorax]MDM0001119.1 group III truncated hemoglobin [Variovorax sp. J22P240]MDM0049794.1 group III truncated hemoglobin [Variovorax sp. J22R115]
MRSPDLCTEQEIADMVHGFYVKVRQDEMLGPIFNAHIKDWDHHLAKLVDFWSSILRGTRRFNGTPMPKHVALSDLSAELFERWLRLFREEASAQPNRAMGEYAYDLAQRIAQSLWYGYQMSRRPRTAPTDLRHD